ncbi:hypothetical protein HWC53_gp079 [Bacillus phage vB_BmeM-Goe8]|uniref:Uncharacterized protein n=1 Tax=Bacillus phage vB_BmeM-Goe8 TaxID=2593638 RepID=A0A516KN48_9CAUD|nr:hypothetical protein HWC53_gp079 [Bacillus phage vB_BmeM-Goe8]QDP43010.1 hypothetical protein Goe8_c02370 [Bacillus phage vB_BmeM-Goe8]
MKAISFSMYLDTSKHIRSIREELTKVGFKEESPNANYLIKYPHPRLMKLSEIPLEIVAYEKFGYLYMSISEANPELQPRRYDSLKEFDLFDMFMSTSIGPMITELNLDVAELDIKTYIDYSDILLQNKWTPVEHGLIRDMYECKEIEETVYFNKTPIGSERDIWAYVCTPNEPIPFGEHLTILDKSGIPLVEEEKEEK